ncbi:MAG TPA: Gfo/Idh/MocA family oxidoreductase [Gemmataceae bacterium]|nr:Gfo/Idh/MocA family oxidoreductase [Gemmataceae bacterium]
MPSLLQIGIIGLGRRWRRCRPALYDLRDRLTVRAVCDQRPIRAERAARELGCAAAAGPTDLLDRDDVQALVLLDAQWFGLWPLEQAARVGKPVLCTVPLAADDAHADDVMARVRAAGLFVVTGPAPMLSPVVTRLRDLLAARLGGPRLVRCDWCGRDAKQPAELPGAHVLPSLMQVCAGLFGGEPTAAWATASPARAASVLLEFAGDKAALLNLWTGNGVQPACRCQVVTDAGEATVVWPNTLRWRDGEGSHTIRTPRCSMLRLLLERFLDALAAGTPPAPGLEEAYRALLWARAARRSLAEGRRVEINAGDSKGE